MGSKGTHSASSARWNRLKALAGPPASQPESAGRSPWARPLCPTRASRRRAQALRKKHAP